MVKALDLKGKRFGRWIVSNRVENSKGGQSYWLCKCDCGNKREVIGSSLKLGFSKSCGCLQKETIYQLNFKHGCAIRGKATRTWRIWQGMKDRCNRTTSLIYKWYGGRGISVCERWLVFKNFLADMGEAPEGLTLDRKDNNGNYEPDNCRWITQAQQIRNSNSTKLNFLKVQVIKKLLKESKLRQWEIAEIFNVSRPTINSVNRERTWKDIKA